MIFARYEICLGKRKRNSQERVMDVTGNEMGLEFHVYFDIYVKLIKLLLQ
jgi:hypothetical protein